MSFEDRRLEFENKYAHDEELRFRIESRRNRLMARWAADKLGLDEESSEQYVRTIVALGSSRAGEEAIVSRLRDDFRAAHIEQSDHQIRRRLSELLADAEQQVTTA